MDAGAGPVKEVVFALRSVGILALPIDYERFVILDLLLSCWGDRGRCRQRETVGARDGSH